ncbi:hypothetical protein, partial [Bacteroides heparinolyticus]|uniref:hypothetical protein n=1 Tax=Prevotella heparinolytica TaxID=28113 RepID=UPI0035A0492A
SIGVFLKSVAYVLTAKSLKIEVYNIILNFWRACAIILNIDKNVSISTIRKRRIHYDSQLYKAVETIDR